MIGIARPAWLRLVRSSRHAVVVALALWLGLFAFEAGRHSAHHPHGDAASACAIAGATGHLSIVSSPIVSAAPTRGAVAVLAADAAAPAPAVRPLAPDQGRAPPSFSV